MRTRPLGTSSLQLTTIGLGTWAIGGGDWKFGWGAQDESDAIEAIVRAVELGINWIDTAAVYGNGRSEELVGKALMKIPEAKRPLVATKFGRIIQPDGSIVGNINRESIVEECEASLRRLNVEAIDLYQMHWPDPDQQIEDAWHTLVDLKRQGRVRHIGVSNHNVAQMQRLQAIHPIASLQPPYNMMSRQIEQDILPYCAENKIGVICYSPMGKGLLTGRFTRERAERLSADDHRSRDPKFQEPLLSINLQLVEGLERLAAKHDRNVAQVAVAWTLRRPEITSAIVGARHPTQIEGTAPAGDWALSDDELQEIDRLLKSRDESLAALGPLDTGRV